jgi:hypothetical protein
VTITPIGAAIDSDAEYVVGDRGAVDDDPCGATARRTDHDAAANRTVAVLGNRTVRHEEFSGSGRGELDSGGRIITKSRNIDVLNVQCAAVDEIDRNRTVTGSDGRKALHRKISHSNDYVRTVDGKVAIAATLKRIAGTIYRKRQPVPVIGRLQRPK